MSFSIVTVNVPEVNIVFKSGKVFYSDPQNKKNNVATLKRINSNYGTFINKWGGLLDIPNGVIAGFIATESSGYMVGPNVFEATGLMQATPVSTYDGIVNWARSVKDQMPSEIVAEINLKLPGILKKPAPAYSSVKQSILNILKTDVSFNILCGCIIIRWMCERFSNNGNALFNRAMIAYNAGAYTSSQLNTDPAKKKKLLPNTNVVDTATLVSNPNVPLESRYYLIKMLGVDGFLDLIYRQNLV